MNKEKALHYVNTNNLTGIKAGFDRQTFTDIWMVAVDDRIFARSWGFAEKSWYNSFLQDSQGELKCGDEVFAIKGLVPADKNELAEAINNAYLTKYNTEKNIEYSKGIIREKHVEKTMEFILCEE